MTDKTWHLYVQILAALAVVGLGLCAVVFAAAEQQSEDDTSSVRNLLAATRASITPMLAMKNKLSHMTVKQQMLYDAGMEDESTKHMHIAYQTFLKGQDEGVVAEFDALNAMFACDFFHRQFSCKLTTRPRSTRPSTIPLFQVSKCRSWSLSSCCFVSEKEDYASFCFSAA